MSLISSFLNPQRGYESARNTLNDSQQIANQYGQMAQLLQSPYNQFGQQTYQNNLGPAMQKLLNPGALQDEWLKGYETSGAAKNTQDMATQHGLNSASSMGLLGSTPALQAMQAGNTQIGLADRQNYLNDMMQKYMSGVGIGQNVYNTGASSAAGMANNMMQQGNNATRFGENEANMDYGAQNAQGSLFGNLLGLGAGVFGGPLAGLATDALAKKWNLSGNDSGGNSARDRPFMPGHRPGVY